MSEQEKRPPAEVTQTNVDQFLAEVAQRPRSLGRRGRLLFAMDATASRQPTWDHACQLQAEMFTRTEGLGVLDIQLCFYRGYDEFRATPWHDNPADLLRAGLTVRCRGGHTQIRRVLRHAVLEHQRQPIQAVVFIGDCMEESVDELCQLAGELGILGVPLFLFQEGWDRTATDAFVEMARLSHGAHCRFDSHSPELLSELLQAVAVFATGGRDALDALCRHASPALQALTRQLEAPKP